MAKHVYYFCDEYHTYTLGIFAAYWAPRIGAQIRIVPYNVLPQVPGFGAGAFILTDFDRMSPGRAEKVAQFADHLQRAGRTVLNHPRCTLQRLELLHALHAANINDFTAWRLAEWGSVERFPVFIRHVGQAGRRLTELIPDAAALKAAIAQLPPQKQGKPDRIIVEFANCAGPDGRFVKYSAFKVGGMDYALMRDVGPHWWVKFTQDASSEDLAAQEVYARTNPHREALEEVWRIAGADYGRIDYGISDGRVQVFEINTSPTIAYLPEPGIDRAFYAKPHEDALLALLDTVANDVPTAKPLFGHSGKVWRVDDVHRSLLEWGRTHWPRNWAA